MDIHLSHFMHRMCIRPGRDMFERISEVICTIFQRSFILYFDLILLVIRFAYRTTCTSCSGVRAWPVLCA